jgi:hypothetical protein
MYITVHLMARCDATLPHDSQHCTNHKLNAAPGFDTRVIAQARSMRTLVYHLAAAVISVLYVCPCQASQLAFAAHGDLPRPLALRVLVLSCAPAYEPLRCTRKSVPAQCYTYSILTV